MEFANAMSRTKRRFRPQVWIVPLLYAAAAFMAGLSIPRIEARFWPELFSPLNASAAIAMYSSIASGMMALTGIVFSLMFLIVQFSALSFSPRLTVWIASRPILYHTAGIFTATFVYAVAALSGVGRGAPKKFL
jgi:uncharacterized membrane protein